jgi:hypothetical protein
MSATASASPADVGLPACVSTQPWGRAGYAHSGTINRTQETT